MPTEYGPITLKFKLSTDKETLKVLFTPRFRCCPKHIILHTPPIEGLKRIKLNEKLIKSCTKEILIKGEK